MRVRMFVLLLMTACAAGALAQTQAVQPAAEVRELALVAGRGELLQFPSEVSRVAIAEPKIADAVVVSPREVMVNAKSVGRTTLVIWEKDSAPVRYEIRVTTDTTDFDNLRRELREGLPGATLSVTGNEETLVLTGTAKDAEQSKKAAALASTRGAAPFTLLILTFIFPHAWIEYVSYGIALSESIWFAIMILKRRVREELTNVFKAISAVALLLLAAAVIETYLISLLS